ncbi:DUF2062 domain-containing protein [Paenibacillus tarimensis]
MIGEISIRNLLRKLRYNIILLFRQNKGAHQISLGFVIGFFPCWFPTFGVGPALSIALTKFVRGNIPAAVIAASLGSILWPVLFFMNYKTGTLLTGLASGDRDKIPIPLDMEEGWPEVYVEPAEHINSWGQAGIDFIVGSTFNSLIMTAVGYLIVRLLVTRYRFVILQLIRGGSAWKRYRQNKTSRS